MSSPFVFQNSRLSFTAYVEFPNRNRGKKNNIGAVLLGKGFYFRRKKRIHMKRHKNHSSYFEL